MASRREGVKNNKIPQSTTVNDLSASEDEYSEDSEEQIEHGNSSDGQGNYSDSNLPHLARKGSEPFLAPRRSLQIQSSRSDNDLLSQDKGSDSSPNNSPQRKFKIPVPIVPTPKRPVSPKAVITPEVQNVNNVDLTFVTHNLLAIVNSPSPASSKRSCSILEICEVLKKYQDGNAFLILNLSEKTPDIDDNSEFRPNIKDFPFPENHAPPLDLLFESINTIHSYLKTNSNGVVTLFCRGVGRLGVIAVAYLFYAGFFKDVHKASKYFTQRRNDNQFTIQPSQISSAASKVELNIPEMIADVLIRVFESSDRKPIFHLIFNTSFLTNSLKLVFYKYDLDFLSKYVRDKRFAQEFSIDLELSSEPRELKQMSNDLVASMKTNFSMLQLLPQLIDGRLLNQLEEDLKLEFQHEFPEIDSSTVTLKDNTTSKVPPKPSRKPPSQNALKERNWKNRVTTFYTSKDIQSFYKEEEEKKNEATKAGYLEKLTRFKNWKLQWFELRDGRLIQYKTKGGDVQKVFPLDPPCKIEQYHPEKKTYAFQLTTAVKSITLKAESEREMHDWLSMLLKHKLMKEPRLSRIEKSSSIDETPISEPILQSEHVSTPSPSSPPVPSSKPPSRRNTVDQSASPINKTLSEQEREQLAEELENMRKSLELQLKEHNRLKQEAISKEDFQTAAVEKNKVQQIEGLLREYESIKEQEKRKAERKVKEIQESLNALKQRKQDAIEKEDFETAHELKVQIEQAEIQLQYAQRLYAQHSKSPVQSSPQPERDVRTPLPIQKSESMPTVPVNKPPLPKKPPPGKSATLRKSDFQDQRESISLPPSGSTTPATLSRKNSVLETPSPTQSQIPPTVAQDEEDEVQLMEGKPKRAPPTIPPIPPRSTKPKDVPK